MNLDFIKLGGSVIWLVPENRCHYIERPGVVMRINPSAKVEARLLDFDSVALRGGFHAPVVNQRVRPLKSVLLSARNAAGSTTPDLSKWMFAPGGVHTITPAAGEGSAEITLRIDESTTAVLNASLNLINYENRPQRAYFDAEHDESGGATAWPQRFVWEEGGVFAVVSPSALGAHLVDGQIVRAFSPSFYSDAALPKKINRGQHVKVAAGQRGSSDNPARMTGLIYPACGTLTNNPAFRQILPLW